MSTAASVVQPASPGSEQRYSTTRLLAGLLGRTWLWFVGGCLLITLLPVLIGWRPFVVESGSMAPRIHVGDVVLAAPVAQASDLVGRVTVFDDPAKPGTTVGSVARGRAPSGARREAPLQRATLWSAA